MKINSYYSFELVVTTPFSWRYFLEYTSRLDRKPVLRSGITSIVVQVGFDPFFFLERKKC